MYKVVKLYVYIHLYVIMLISCVNCVYIYVLINKIGYRNCDLIVNLNCDLIVSNKPMLTIIRNYIKP